MRMKVRNVANFDSWHEQEEFVRALYFWNVKLPCFWRKKTLRKLVSPQNINFKPGGPHRLRLFSSSFCVFFPYVTPFPLFREGGREGWAGSGNSTNQKKKNSRSKRSPTNPRTTPTPGPPLINKTHGDLGKRVSFSFLGMGKRTTETMTTGERWKEERHYRF